MIYIIAFLVLLSIYDIVLIVQNNNKDKKKYIPIYIILALISIGFGMYYEKSEYGKSISYYLLKLIGKSY